MDQLIKDFLQESRDNLDRLDQDFVSLESDPDNSDLMGSIFRTIHTVKGTCGFLGFPKLEALSHAGENLLSQLRSGELKLHSAISDALLQMVDAIREYLAEIEASENEGPREFKELIATLKSCRRQRPLPSRPSSCLRALRRLRRPRRHRSSSGGGRRTCARKNQNEKTGDQCRPPWRGTRSKGKGAP